MMSWLSSFHFLHPQWLWLLLLAPVVAWCIARRNPEARALARIADADLLPHLMEGQAASSAVPAWLSALFVALAALASAGPTVRQQTVPLFAERPAQVVVVSMSDRMLAHDVVPDRLSRTRYKVRALYAANSAGLNALVAYSGEAFTVAPLTTDVHSVDDLLTALSPDTMPVDGDDPARAIDEATSILRHAQVARGSIVVVTDHADSAALAAARRARAAGGTVSVLGMGTTQGGPVPVGDGGFLRDDQGNIVMAARDDASLQALASAGGGRYVPVANDASDVQALAALLHADGPEQAVDGATGGQWQDLGPWLVLPLLPLLALAVRRGWLLSLALLLMPLSPAHADGMADAFRTRDQQAARALAAGDAKQALALAQDPSLRGAAAYRAGDFAAAETAWRGVDTSDGQYNLGNALARQQRYKDALDAYDRALKLDPKNADAAANRKIVEDAMRQQTPPQSPPPQDKDGKGNAKGGGQDGGQQPPKAPGSDSSDTKDQQDQQGQDGDKPKDDAGDKDGRNPSPGNAPDKQDPNAAPKQDPQGKGSDPQQAAGDPAAKSAAEQAKADEAQQALKQRMDQALGKPQPDKGDAHDLGAIPADEASSKLPADVRRQLMRVPDDPGGLLRRKFMLEYQRRHGGAVEE
jgi:Ca-activated chloride channel family protein